MFRPLRLLWLGLVLLGLAAVRVLAFPFIDPANKADPGLWWEIYNFSILLWIPALATIALASLLQCGKWVLRLTRRDDR